LFKSQFQVDISLKIAPSDRLAFVLVPTTELKSALSSLIDNAVEALRGEGSVRVELTVKSGKVLIEVSDNGSGIDSSLLKLLGGKRQTFGKAKGNGLGLYHATSVVRACGGSLDIVSILGEGTKVSVTLPKVLTPAWFADSLLVSEGQEIIILDDDPSIHAIWQERLSVLGYTQNLKIFSFQGIVEFERFMSSAHLIKPLFLLDYELVPSHITGLEIVSRYNLSASAVLVTSRFEDVSVKQRCQELGVRMLPKSIVWFIPLASKSVRLEASCEDVQ
jgi:hypothetical protein